MSVWQHALSQHLLLQIQQKKVYAAERARVAAAFPRAELYLARSPSNVPVEPRAISNLRALLGLGGSRAQSVCGADPPSPSFG